MMADSSFMTPEEVKLMERAEREGLVVSTISADGQKEWSLTEAGRRHSELLHKEREWSIGTEEGWDPLLSRYVLKQ